MNKLPFSASAMFCEDARDEIQGSLTLVGILTDGIKVSSFPGMMPKLVLYVRITLDPEVALPKRLALSLVANDTVITEIVFDENLLQTSRSETIAAGSDLHTVVGRLQASPFPMEGPSHLQAIIDHDGMKLTVGDLWIKLADPTDG